VQRVQDTMKHVELTSKLPAAPDFVSLDFCRNSPHIHWTIIKHEDVNENDVRIPASCLPLLRPKNSKLYYLYNGNMIVPVFISKNKAIIDPTRINIPNIYGLLYTILGIYFYQATLYSKSITICASRQLLLDGYGLIEQSVKSVPGGCYFLDINTSFEEYESTVISKSLLKEIHYEMRRHVREDTPIIFTAHERDSLPIDEFTQAVNFKIERGVRKKHKPISDKFAELHYPVYKSRGIVTSLVVSGHETARCLFLYDIDGVLYHLAAVKNFDNTRNVSYGKIIFYESLKYLFNKGIRRFTLGGGDFGYKQRFGAKLFPLYDIAYTFDPGNASAINAAFLLLGGSSINDVERYLGGRFEQIFGWKSFDKIGVEFYKQHSIEELGLDPSSNRYQATMDEVTNSILDSVPEYFHKYGFADIGSGKGKVLYAAQKYSYSCFLGVEISSYLCEISRQNFDILNLRNIRILNKNALEVTPDDISGIGVFYLYNSFKANVLKQFVDTLLTVAAKTCQPICFCYYNDIEFKIFDESGFVLHKKFGREDNWKYNSSSIYIYL
jgi:hypothetical protein